MRRVLPVALLLLAAPAAAFEALARWDADLGFYGGEVTTN